MTMSMVKSHAVTGGVDTHADSHAAAALDGIGGLLGVSEFPATPAGYAQLLGWLQGFGTVCLVGIEGTGSYGAGLARHISAAGIRVVEVDRSDRQDRRRAGKSDPLDAVSAARAALSGRASGAPRGRDGQVEAIRALMVAKRTARAQRTQTINQARALIITGPDDIRTRFTGQAPAELVAELAALRPRPGSMVRYHTLLALRELGRRACYLDGQLARLDELITPLVTARAPGLLSLFGVGPDTAAMLLIAAGDHPAGSAPKPPGRTCARPPRSRPPQARWPGTGSTAAATGKPTTPCGGSSSPGWAPTRRPAPTSPGAARKACPSPRSSAASNATQPAKPTATCGPADNPNSGGGLTR
jgi:transposase